MIQFQRDGSVVKILIEAGSFVTPNTWHASLEFSQPVIADIIMGNLRNKLSSLVTAIRKEAYEQGWKDAKGHKTKSAWFSGQFRVGNP